MCRYAWHNYRDHLACFSCRKAFKHWQWGDRDEAYWKIKLRRPCVPRKIVCPECTRPMGDMGLDFRAPRKDDREAWRILQVLHGHGFGFHGCGCDAGGFVPPRHLREVPAWLDEHRQRSEGDTLLRKSTTRGGRSGKGSSGSSRFHGNSFGASSPR